jgi:membrane-associated phospholipid phosphatase
VTEDAPAAATTRPTIPAERLVEAAAARPKRRRRASFSAMGAAFAGVAFVALAVFAHGIPYFPIDLEITQALQGLHSPLVTVPFDGLNAFGFVPIVPTTFGLVVLLLFVARMRWEAVSAAFATLGAAGLTEVVKGLVGRSRPSPDLVHVANQIDSPGFPAGHVLNFTPFVGFLCYLAYVHLAPSWRRTALISILLLLIVLMGPARIYDGEHWPSDVLGSYLLGFVWLIATIAFYEWGRRRKRRSVARAASPTSH